MANGFTKNNFTMGPLCSDNHKVLVILGLGVFGLVLVLSVLVS